MNQWSEPCSTISSQSHLAGGFKPSEKILVNWDDYPQCMEKYESCSSHHQPNIPVIHRLSIDYPKIIQTTNQQKCSNPIKPPFSYGFHHGLPVIAKSRLRVVHWSVAKCSPPFGRPKFGPRHHVGQRTPARPELRTRADLVGG